MPQIIPPMYWLCAGARVHDPSGGEGADHARHPDLAGAGVDPHLDELGTEGELDAIRQLGATERHGPPRIERLHGAGAGAVRHPLGIFLHRAHAALLQCGDGIGRCRRVQPGADRVAGLRHHRADTRSRDRAAGDRCRRQVGVADHHRHPARPAARAARRRSARARSSRRCRSRGSRSRPARHHPGTR